MNFEIKKYNIKLRLVDISDASFILKLRGNEKLSQFLSRTSKKLADQERWIQEYKIREAQKLEYYFIAIDEEGNRLGTTRIYNIEANSFETGSWLFSEDAPSGVAIKSDIIGREFGFENLGLDFCKFEVRKANVKVLRYHYRYSPEVIGEDELNYYFRISRQNFRFHSNKLLKIL